MSRHPILPAVTAFLIAACFSVASFADGRVTKINGDLITGDIDVVTDVDLSGISGGCLNTNEVQDVIESSFSGGTNEVNRVTGAFDDVAQKADSALQSETDPTVGLTNGTIYIKGVEITPLTEHQSLEPATDYTTAVSNKMEAAVADRYTKSEADGRFVPNNGQFNVGSDWMPFWNNEPLFYWDIGDSWYINPNRMKINWMGVCCTPTTLSGYGITDAKIENETITLGSQTITPILNGGSGSMSTLSITGSSLESFAPIIKRNPLDGSSSEVVYGISTDGTDYVHADIDLKPWGDSLISASNPTFSNAVLAVSVDTNAVAQIGELKEFFDGLPVGTVGTSLGGIILAILGAAAALKKKTAHLESDGTADDDFATDLMGKQVSKDAIDAEIIEKGTAPDAHLEAPTDERLKLVLADNTVAYDSAKALPYKLTSAIGDRVIASLTLNAASTDITLPSTSASDTTVKDFILDVTNAYSVEGVATDAGINIPRTDVKLVTRDGESLSEVTTVKAGKSAFICFTQKSPVVVDGVTYPCWFVVKVELGDPA